MTGKVYTGKMFERLHDKLGANFFLTMFLLALVTIMYLFYELEDARKEGISQQKQFNELRAADNNEWKVYFIEKEKKVLELNNRLQQNEQKTIVVKKKLQKIHVK